MHASTMIAQVLTASTSCARFDQMDRYFLAQLLKFELSTSAVVIENKILESQPILEAFGNAKTGVCVCVCVCVCCVVLCCVCVCVCLCV
jgi:hypothetical protein